MMTRDSLLTLPQLVEQVRQDFAAIRDFKLTPRMVRDWVDEGFVDGPIEDHGLGRGRGKTWLWSARSLHQIEYLCRLKLDGARRFDGFRLALWLDGLTGISAPAKRAATREFPYARRWVLRKMRSTLTHGTATTAQGRAIARALGPLSASLAPTGFQYSNAAYAEMNATARFEATHPSVQTAALELMRATGVPKMVADEVQHPLRILALAYSALFGKGDANENFGLKSLKRADAKTYETARSLLRLFQTVQASANAAMKFQRRIPGWRSGPVEFLEQFAALNRDAAKRLSKYPYRLTYFAAFVHLAHHWPREAAALSAQWSKEIRNFRTTISALHLLGRLGFPERLCKSAQQVSDAA